MDLQDPTAKMSTTGGTEAGRVYVLDEPDAIRKKFRSAKTDSGREVERGEGKEGVANLIDILSVARGSTPEEIEAEFEGSGYGDFKTAVGDAVVDLLAPVRERYDGAARRRGRAGARPRRRRRARPGPRRTDARGGPPADGRRRARVAAQRLPMAISRRRSASPRRSIA